VENHTTFKKKNSLRFFAIYALAFLIVGLFAFSITFAALGSTFDGQPASEEIMPLATATAELTKVLMTPADEPTPDLTFTFNIERHSFNGNTTLYHQLPQIGTVVNGVGTIELNINEANGSPETSGGTTTLRRSVDILEDISFALPLPVGTYVWRVSEVEDSSGINALAGRSSVAYSSAMYELTVAVTGTTAATRAAAVTFAAIEPDAYAARGTPMYAWGNNVTGQLGLGNHTSQLRPTRAGTADNWVHVSSSGNSSAAINAYGHLYVWGNNRTHVGMGRGGGVVTEGTAATRITSPERLFMPNEVPGDPDTHHYWVMVDAAGTSPGVRMLALNDEGQIWAWGVNAVGQLGDGTTTNRGTPVRIGAHNDWKTVSTVSSGPALAAPLCFTMAITVDGHLYSWGANQDSQLGRTATTAAARNNPARVNTASTGTTEWSVARAAGSGTAFAICTDGQLYSWGSNADGQLGRAGGTTATPTPTVANAPDSPATHGDPVNAWVDIVQQVNDPRVGLALTDDGRIFTWAGGTGSIARLGRPGGAAASATRTNRPVQVGTASNWVAIGGGAEHSVAMTADGRLYAWGNNGSGRVGDGTTTARSVPTFILQTFGLEGISQTGSGEHSMALIRTDPMVFTNVYTVEHPDYIQLEAEIVKRLRELTRTPAQTNSALSFGFEIERYSFDGNTDASYVANLPGLGITPFAGGVYTLPVAMNHASVTASHSGGVTTLSRAVDILADAQFDEPGIYVWRISEVSGSSGVTAPAHMAYSPAVYYLTVTITETGTAGDTTLSGAVTVVVGTADVPPAAVNTMVFTNTHSATSTLRISKTAMGGMLPAGQQFPFTIAITGSALCPGDATFSARLYTAATGGGASTFVREEVFDSGEGRTINIEGGQYFIFNTIAQGATFNITEAVPANFSGSVAIVVGGQTVTPAVPDVGADDINRNLSTGNRVIGAGANSAAFTNVHHWEVPTGLTVTNDDGTWVILAIAVATILGAGVATKSALQGAAPIAPVVGGTAFVGQSAHYASNVGKATFRRIGSLILRGLGR